MFTETLTCDMKRDCTADVTHIDNKGFLYCATHGQDRRASGIPCRKMQKQEIDRLRQGRPARDKDAAASKALHEATA